MENNFGKIGQVWQMMKPILSKLEGAHLKIGTDKDIQNVLQLDGVSS